MAVASCEPSALLANNSCLSCLSASELLKVFVLALASGTAYELPEHVAQLADSSACYTCLTDKQLLQVLVSAYVEDQFGELSISEIKEKIKCLDCASPKQVKAMIAYLTCINIR